MAEVSSGLEVSAKCRVKMLGRTLLLICSRLRLKEGEWLRLAYQVRIPQMPPQDRCDLKGPGGVTL